MLVFDGQHFTEVCYGMADGYMRWLLRELGVPHRDHLGGYRTMGEEDVPLLWFDDFGLKFPHVPSAPHSDYPFRRFVLFESEPHCNLVTWVTRSAWHRGFFAARCCLVITLNAGNVQWWRDNFPGVKVAFLPQGYCPWLDRTGMFASQTRGTEYDAAMPGEANTVHRRQCIGKLTAAGIKVNSRHATSVTGDLDFALHLAKIFVYVPCSAEHVHYATQRILCALNKGACVVAVGSSDAEMELRYGDLYVTCSEGELVRTCLAMLRDDEWRRQARWSYTRYRSKHLGTKVANEYGAIDALMSATGEARGAVEPTESPEAQPDGEGDVPSRPPNLSAAEVEGCTRDGPDGTRAQ